MKTEQKIENNQSKPADRKPFKKKLPPKGESRVNLISANSGKLVAITGAIATGKSFVLECFAKLGFEVFNYDKAVHSLMKREGKAFAMLSSLFPDAVNEHGIDRAQLSKIIVAHPEKLKILENILHPLARQAQIDFIVNVRKTSGKSIVFEVPLLFENNRQKAFDYVVVVTAPLAVSKERAFTRDGMTEEKYNTIIEKQVKDSVRLKGAHAVIKTGISKEATFNQVKNIVKETHVRRNSTRHRDNRPRRKEG
jgi:dephospho-CoA kinase